MAAEVPFPAMGAPLDRITRSIQVAVTRAVPRVQELASAFLADPGSRVRPGLMLTVAGLFPEPVEARLEELGEMLELLHLASLLHERAGSSSDGILLGDLLLARSMTLLARHAEPAIVSLVAGITAELAEGQILEVQARRRGTGTEADALRIAALRTGGFLGRAARLGALAAGADRELPPIFEDFGRAAGTAYRLLDAGMQAFPGLEPTRAAALARGELATARQALDRLPESLDPTPLHAWVSLMVGRTQADAER